MMHGQQNVKKSTPSLDDKKTSTVIVKTNGAVNIYNMWVTLL
jgi:hypothetical protein